MNSLSYITGQIVIQALGKQIVILTYQSKYSTINFSYYLLTKSVKDSINYRD